MVPSEPVNVTETRKSSLGFILFAYGDTLVQDRKRVATKTVWALIISTVVKETALVQLRDWRNDVGKEYSYYLKNGIPH